jgi:hypothetical protein
MYNRHVYVHLPDATTESPSPPIAHAFTLPLCPASLLVVTALATSHTNTTLSPPTLTNFVLSSLTAISSTSYPCASYFCINAGFCACSAVSRAFPSALDVRDANALPVWVSVNKDENAEDDDGGSGSSGALDGL